MLLLIAPILILRHLVKRKKLKTGASVVFTSSLAGLGKSTVGNSMYTACKGAISAFVQGAALELVSKGIRVNAVCPGMVDTGILDSGTITDEQLATDKKNYPLGRYGQPQDIAWAMIYLLSDASSCFGFDVYETPGHNPSCLCFANSEVIFTGDAYIPGCKVVTNLPHCDKVMAEVSMERILFNAKNKVIYPGHTLL